MDINDAVTTIESFFESYRNDAWSPTEIRTLPSGDSKDAIKIFFNFGPDVGDGEVDALKDAGIAALREAHPDIAETFALEVRAVAD